MYEQHFGLSKRPFKAKVTGPDIFVGPQTAKAMSGLKKALQATDAVVVLSGPAGSGKSTLATKALEALSDTHTVIRIGRMSLAGEDVLEFLLEELGATELPRGPIRQVAALRKHFTDLEAASRRIVIVVEDALLIGSETISELEALTAADTGDSAGAAIVMMGDERLGDFLRKPELARLTQRARLHAVTAPMSEAELRGYLMHCFRNAGGEFEKAFEADCVAVIHAASGGTPRIANNIVEAVMTTAAAKDIAPVTSALVAEVAQEQFDYEPPVSAGEPPGTIDAEPESGPEVEPTPEPIPEPVLEAEPEPVIEHEPEPEPETQADPVIVFSDEPVDASLEDDEIPELIQDTLPDLEVLAPEVVEADALTEMADEPAPLPELEPLPELQPELTVETESTADSAPEDVPDWERDPTLAQLMPDLDALEKAMAVAHGDEEEPQPEPALEEPVETERAPEPEPEIIPEITLDNAIKERIDSNLIDEPGAVSVPGADTPASAGAGSELPNVRIPAAKSKKADAEIERITAELAKAKSIEDVDDKLAETLFGEELNMIAAQVVADGPDGESANDASLFDTGAAQMAQAVGTPADEVVAAGEDAFEVQLETREQGGEAGFDLSASQRLKTVRALSADPHGSAGEPASGFDPGPEVPARDAVTPEPIEDQINTSMTQTLKALDVQPPITERNVSRSFADDDDDDEEEKKGGFFSRFRRS